MGVVEEMSGGESYDPESHDQRSNGENPFPDGAVVVSEGLGFANSKDLASKADGHEDNAERESEPGQGHGNTFYPNQHRCGKRKVRTGRGNSAC
jgi:hypothetical protein